MKEMKSKLLSLFLKFLALTLGITVYFAVLKLQEVNFESLFKILVHYKICGAIVFVSLLWTLGYTLAWRRFLERALQQTLAFKRVLFVKMMGEGVNTLTPFGFVLGDSTRVALLGESVVAVTGTVVADRVLHQVSAFLFSLTALIFVPIAFPEVKVWVWAPLMALYGVMAFFLLYFLYHSTRGQLSFLNGLLSIFKRVTKVHRVLFSINEGLSQQKNMRTCDWLFSFAWHFMGRIWGALEITIIIWGLTGEVHFLIGGLLSAVTSFVSSVFGFIPGALGFLEGAYAVIFLQLGMTAETGILVQSFRRVRVFFWMMVPFVLFDVKKLKKIFKS